MRLIMKKYKYTGIFLATSLLLMVLGCSKIFDVKPSEVTDISDNYNNFPQTRISLMGGNSALLRTVAPQMVVYNEARGDLLMATSSAGPDIIALDNQDVDASNIFVDPRPWYMIIMNCNDELSKLHGAIKNDPINFTAHDSLICYWETYATRAWCYLQLARMYKQVPYYRTTITSVGNLNYTMMTKEQLADTLLFDLNQFRNDVIVGGGMGNLANADAKTNRLRMTNYAVAMLKGECYMIKQDWPNANRNFREVIRNDLPVDGSTGAKLKNRITGSYFNKSAWTNIFDIPAFPSTEQTYVYLVSAGYDTKEKTNYLYNLFTPGAPAFNNIQPYQLQPSDYAITNWRSQRNYTIQNGKAVYDVGDLYRGYGASYRASYLTISSNNAISYAGYYVNKFRSNIASILLFRDAEVNLKWAEAINRVGYPDSAINIINPQNVSLTTYQTPFKSMIGIRGRVAVDSIAPIPNTLPLDERILRVENAIVDEYALECAFEGIRWQTLVRIAERRNDPAFLADKVARKYSDPAKAAAIRAKLMDPNNWYLTFPIDKLPTKYNF
jgi:starch-binding outer membrane protein, SusD/RagB family